MSLPGLKMVTTLAVNGNKKGLRDKPLKMGIDEYRQRLESGGKTKEESEYDRQWDKDERVSITDRAWWRAPGTGPQAAKRSTCRERTWSGQDQWARIRGWNGPLYCPLNREGTRGRR